MNRPRLSALETTLCKKCHPKVVAFEKEWLIYLNYLKDIIASKDIFAKNLRDDLELIQAEGTVDQKRLEALISDRERLQKSVEDLRKQLNDSGDKIINEYLAEIGLERIKDFNEYGHCC